MSSEFWQEWSEAELAPVNNLTKRSNSTELQSEVQRLRTANNSRNLAPIDDINLKIFDEICEERYAKLKLDVLNLTNIDTIPSDVLPHLAEQYHITGDEGWIFCKTEAEKRALLKNAIQLHKYRGTKYAIISALEVLDLRADIAEWFEYNGEPFFFKVFIDLQTSFESELESRIVNIINAHKNVRSWLEKLTIYLTQTAVLPIASYVLTSEEVTI